MFRSKAKKTGGGGATRKRKEVDADDEPHAAAVSTEEGAERISDVAAAAAAAISTNGEGAEPTVTRVQQPDAHAANGGSDRRDNGDEAEEEDRDSGEDEDAVLERMRNRAKRGKPKHAMTFSSTKMTKKKSSGSASVAANASVGSLSFEDDTKGVDRSRNRHKKIKIRPNLMATAPAVHEDEGEQQETNNSYTFEMLDALRKEQNVLLRNVLEKDEQHATTASTASVAAEAMDIDMVDLDGATIVMEERDVQVENKEEEQKNEDEEEFIPLHSKMMQSRKKRNRVTFGMPSSGPKLSKTTEVDEPMDEIDNEDAEGENDPSRQWEEELMRRGGHHAPVPDSEKTKTSSGKAYPTRKKVPFGSLSDVLTKLQKSLDAASFENDRAERELARIDAEVSLIEETLQKQRQELLTSSEEFEYFQVVEDYVKGLSFCLREKMPEIEDNEKELAKMRASSIGRIRDSERRDAREHTDKLVAHDVIAYADIRGLQIFDVNNANSIDNQPDQNEALEKFQRGFTDTMPVIKQDDVLDVFADAVDDMNSLQHVYGKFQEWRSKFPEVYKNCYCDVALEKLYAPYVRAEMLFWDPLSASQLSKSNGRAWGFDSIEWFQVLRQHVRETSTENDDGPVVSLVRDVVLGKVLTAVTSYFDPCSSLHSHSIGAVLEEISKYGYTQHCELALTALVDEITARFTFESKQIPLVAIPESAAQRNHAIWYHFATYQLGRFNALLDNVLTFFVALPREAGQSQVTAFRCVMQILHQLLAFLTHCQQTNKTLLVPQAVQTVSQLTSSPYLQQLLSSSSQEQELQHVLKLFAPFVAAS
uniref:GCF C-terminal domain-containing protein n=1 Tax=Globisporangium ultimum (strain ATCC 200006 / CBS 805.95 / DAOM BR144) TaxID=431595 RepID=K3W7D0_GLOUD